ncbi:MAG: DNA methyltransferase [Pirellulaceae bacterium]|nr:DNA methyltransferase [Pirellulaceae bacterium]
MTLSKNMVHQGDCVQLLNQLDKDSIDLVFADPPFNIGYEYDVYDDDKQASEYLDWCRKWISGVHRALKPNGTFWLAIGDEYAAELKIEAQRVGFHCRSWVIWYYTFGVNCVNGFSRSHTHLFHFVKDKTRFTFNRFNPQIRVKSARQLVYADNRANPNGRLPDNTWITRPQDAPLSFSPSHDTWYFARVAGTFKEREGFHGCQMPEQLLARIIRASSHPQELVLDPFGGSGTTMTVAKKLGRQWMGFELSDEYVKYINERLQKTSVGALIDGAEDPIESAPSTAHGKQRKKGFDEDTEKVVIESYTKVGNGFPADYLLCDKDLDAEFITECRKRGIGGNAFVWNHYLLGLRKAGKLPRATNRPPQTTAEQMDQFGFASEVAWRLLSIDYRKTLDDILCSPDFAAEFDRLAILFGPTDKTVSTIELRRAAISIRKRSNAARVSAAAEFGDWIRKTKQLSRIRIEDGLSELESPGVFILNAGPVGFYVGESENMRARVEQALSNERWRSLEFDSVQFVKNDAPIATKYALKSALAQRELAHLNCRLLIDESELPRGC